MSVPSSTSIALCVGDGSSRVFPFPFKVWDASEIRVLLAGKNGDAETPATVRLFETGGEIELQSPPAKGQAIAILRNMPFSQGQSYTSGSRFDPAVIEERFDRDCAERQQLREAISRAVKAPASSGLAPEDYERDFWARLETGKSGALASIAAKTDAFQKDLAQKEASLAALEKSAGQSEKDAAGALTEMRRVMAGDFANGLKQALNAASAAREMAANIDAVVQEAAEEAAACISLRLATAAQTAEMHASAAAQSACQSAMNGEKTWTLVRSLTEKAGKEAAACILDTAALQAKMASASSRAASASALTSAGLARSVADIIEMKAREVAEKVAGDLMDCLENTCVMASEMSLANAKSAASSSLACADIAAAMQSRLNAAASEAASLAAEKFADCVIATCDACVEMCLAHVKAAASNARLALEYAKEAKQADVCVEAEIRREKDAELESRIAALEKGRIFTGLE